MIISERLNESFIARFNVARFISFFATQNIRDSLKQNAFS